MNKPKVLALAKFIEANEQIEFNMISHQTCAMGFLARMEGDTTEAFSPVLTANVCARLLQVPRNQAYEMFLYAPYQHPDKGLGSISRETVVQALRDWADTGKVPTYCPKGWDKVEG